jgi:hypothetical protein
MNFYNKKYNKTTTIFFIKIKSIIYEYFIFVKIELYNINSILFKLEIIMKILYR